MVEQKRFKKKALNKDDHKAAENGARAVKGVGSFLFAAVLVAINKDNLKSVGKGIADIGKSIIKR